MYTPPRTGGECVEFCQNSTPSQMARGGVTPAPTPSPTGGEFMWFGGGVGGESRFQHISHNLKTPAPTGGSRGGSSQIARRRRKIFMFSGLFSLGICCLQGGFSVVWVQNHQHFRLRRACNTRICKGKSRSSSAE